MCFLSQPSNFKYFTVYKITCLGGEIVFGSCRHDGSAHFHSMNWILSPHCSLRRSQKLLCYQFLYYQCALDDSTGSLLWPCSVNLSRCCQGFIHVFVFHFMLIMLRLVTVCDISYQYLWTEIMFMLMATELLKGKSQRSMNQKTTGYLPAVKGK